jgi:hypothetical protein
MIYAYHGVNMRRYPEVLKHLKPFRQRLEKRATEQEWYELQQPQFAYVPYFDGIKIVYPDIGKVTRFVMDTRGYYGSNTTYFIVSEDWYLLGVLNSSSSFEYLKGTCAALGDEEDGGRLRFFGQYLETLPIPDAPTAERNAVAKLAKQAQDLHTKRRRRVERFLTDLGTSPAASSSRNPLEQPWSLSSEEFARRARHAPASLFPQARDETFALTEEIGKVEREIDERVAALYGVESPAETSDTK